MMTSEIKIYGMGRSVQRNEFGVIDFDRSLQIVRELATTAVFHLNYNILLDLRETEVAEGLTDKLNDIVMECFNRKSAYFKK